MLLIRISQHFNYKPLFSGFVYLNWMNLVVLKVGAYNPQAKAQQAQPRPSVLISVWATGPDRDAQTMQAASGSGSTGQPYPGRRSQPSGASSSCPRLSRMSALVLSHPVPASLPKFTAAPDTGAAWVQLSVSSSPLLNLLNDSPVSKTTIFACSPGYWGTRIRSGGWGTSAVLQELEATNS